MLNLNSPTVQAMLGNTPQGYGNMPVYFGNTPTVTQTMQPTNGVQTPFPSPKEMIAQGGQQMIYNPTPFAPRNIVGGYNPGYNAGFAGYSNPYMGYGTYGGYGNYGYGYIAPPPDQDSRERLELAMMNGLTYEEQLQEESNLYKTISRIVSKNVGRTEEEADRCAAAFDIYCKYPKQEEISRREIKPMHIRLKIGDEVVAEMNPGTTTIREQDYVRNASFVEQMKYRQDWNETEKVKRNNQLYERAPERMFDNTSMLDFFNSGAGVLMADSLNRTLYQQSISRTSQVYDRDNFRQRLLKNNGLRSRDQMKAVERFAGRYGVMPDGRPVSPGHDPAVATSFSYNPKTGQYDVTAPNFIRDRLERARESFIRSIDDN